MKSAKTTTMVTMKNSVEEIKNFLGQNAEAVKKADSNLFSRMEYTSKAMQKGENVTKKDLFDLAKDVMTLLATPAAAETVKPKSETALKKKGGTAKTTEQEAPETDEDEETEETTKETKKKSTKGDSKKGQKKPTQKELDEVLVFSQYVKEFPEKYERDGVQYELARDITSMKDLYEAFEKGEQFVFAFVWTERQLLTFPYYEGVLPQPKKFKDDLDLAAMMYISDELTISYAISTTTDAFYAIKPRDFTSYEPVAHRICDSMEYEIYRVVGGDEETEEGAEE